MSSVTYLAGPPRTGPWLGPRRWSRRSEVGSSVYRMRSWPARRDAMRFPSALCQRLS
jgi:hypothetical protein